MPHNGRSRRMLMAVASTMLGIWLAAEDAAAAGACTAGLPNIPVD